MADAERVKLTAASVARLKPTDKERTVWDADLPGFGVRIRPTGAMSYVAVYRTAGAGGPLRRVTLGSVDAVSAKDARAKAKEVIAGAALGRDEAGERAKARADDTLEVMGRRYLDSVAGIKKATTTRNDESRFARHIVPLLGKKKVSQITSEDIQKARDAIRAGKTAADIKTRKQGRAIVTGGPGAANQVLALLSAIFAYAIEQGARKDNPVATVAKFRGRKQERFLTAEEIGRLGAALHEAETVGLPWHVSDAGKASPRLAKEESQRTLINPHAAAAIRLLILTGARLGEILNAKWTDVDRERGILFVADHKTDKTMAGRKAIFLPAPALEILEKLPRLGVYIISGDSAGHRDEKPRTDLAKPWAAVRRHAGLEDVRLHDLRHTVASIGAASGLGLPIVGKLLGHANAATTARYAHLADSPLRAASDAIGGVVGAALSGRVSEKG